MLSLRAAGFALAAEPTIRLRPTVARITWPPLTLTLGEPTSLRRLTTRFSSAGAELRRIASSRSSRWPHVNPSAVVDQVRFRLRDPGVLQQRSTHLCGPFAIVVEFARRAPAHYVRALAELLEMGRLTTPTGRTIQAADELRHQRGPTNVDAADWVLTATLRDEANVFEDVDGTAEGLEAMTLWGAMAAWTRDLLVLDSHWETTMTSGELNALQQCQDAVASGGVAFLLIRGQLIMDGPPQTEEDVWWRKIPHTAGRPVGKAGPSTKGGVNAWPPNHWVVFLGALAVGGGNHELRISLQLWSWGSEFIVTGTSTSLSKYIHAVVTGRTP